MANVSLHRRPVAVRCKRGLDSDQPRSGRKHTDRPRLAREAVCHHTRARERTPRPAGARLSGGL